MSSTVPSNSNNNFLNASGSTPQTNNISTASTSPFGNSIWSSNSPSSVGNFQEQSRFSRALSTSAIPNQQLRASAQSQLQFSQQQQQSPLVNFQMGYGNSGNFGNIQSTTPSSTSGNQFNSSTSGLSVFSVVAPTPSTTYTGSFNKSNGIIFPDSLKAAPTTSFTANPTMISSSSASHRMLMNSYTNNSSTRGHNDTAILDSEDEDEGDSTSRSNTSLSGLGAPITEATDDVDFLPSSLTDLLTPQELQRRSSKPSSGASKPLFTAIDEHPQPVISGPQPIHGQVHSALISGGAGHFSSDDDTQFVLE
ncbi:unnamed protein product [Ambrosiozyma monospora]|uniref:Unnamed protein product n=1 Tax=Ambrosiozyma monospora TaxID=43982 RepID=A0A9W6YVJ2_AMBMO|nr:unnamed protein product [Ambrosiozyma monospora]